MQSCLILQIESNWLVICFLHLFMPERFLGLTSRFPFDHWSTFQTTLITHGIIKGKLSNHIYKSKMSIVILYNIIILVTICLSQKTYVILCIYPFLIVHLICPVWISTHVMKVYIYTTTNTNSSKTSQDNVTILLH